MEFPKHVVLPPESKIKSLPERTQSSCLCASDPPLRESGADGKEEVRNEHPLYTGCASMWKLSLPPTEEVWQPCGEINPDRSLHGLHRPFRLAPQRTKSPEPIPHQQNGFGASPYRPTARGVPKDFDEAALPRRRIRSATPHKHCRC